MATHHQQQLAKREAVVAMMCPEQYVMQVGEGKGEVLKSILLNRWIVRVPGKEDVTVRGTRFDALRHLACYLWGTRWEHTGITLRSIISNSPE